MAIQELEGEELKAHLHNIYLGFREKCKKDFGPDRPMLPDELFDKYAEIFKGMIENPYVYTRRFAESSHGKAKGPKEIDREMKMTYKMGWWRDIASRRQLEEELAQTHIRLKKPFDLIGYRQYCGICNIQAMVLGAWPIHSFLFRDQEEKVFYWQQHDPVWIANKSNYPSGNELVLEGSLHGYQHLEDISKLLGFDHKDFDDLCIELPNQVNVSFDRASRPLFINTLKTTNMNYDGYWDEMDENGGCGIEDIGNYRIISEKLEKGFSVVNPTARWFQVVSKKPLLSGIDPRRVKYTDGRYGFDGIINVQESRLIGNLAVPYKINKAKDE